MKSFQNLPLEHPIKPNYYEVLGISKKATHEEIDKAYMALMEHVFPLLEPLLSSLPKTNMAKAVSDAFFLEGRLHYPPYQLINDAYLTLSDKVDREAYDRPAKEHFHELVHYIQKNNLSMLHPMIREGWDFSLKIKLEGAIHTPLTWLANQNDQNALDFLLKHFAHAMTLFDAAVAGSPYRINHEVFKNQAAKAQHKCLAVIMGYIVSGRTEYLLNILQDLPKPIRHQIAHEATVKLQQQPIGVGKYSLSIYPYLEMADKLEEQKGKEQPISSENKKNILTPSAKFGINLIEFTSFHRLALQHSFLSFIKRFFSKMKKLLQWSSKQPITTMQQVAKFAESYPCSRTARMLKALALIEQVEVADFNANYLETYKKSPGHDYKKTLFNKNDLREFVMKNLDSEKVLSCLQENKP